MDRTHTRWCACVGTEIARLPCVDSELHATLSKLRIGSEHVGIWRSTRDETKVWLILRVPAVSDEDAIALVGFRSSESLACPSGWGPPCPDPALLAWGREVVGRIQSEQKPSAGASRASATFQGTELQLVARLIRRLKVSDPPERFQNLAGFALQSALRVEVIAWVPEATNERVIVSGGIPGWRSANYRALVCSEGSSQLGSIRIVNEPPPTSAVRRMVGIEVTGQGSQGWLIALNPTDNRCFSHVEVELLEPVASLLATQQNNAKLYADLKDLLFGVIRALTAAIDAKDRYTSGHSERVARIAVRIAGEMGMPAKQQNDLYLMGLLHDVGKIGIDDEVLKKNGPLTSDEYRSIKSHVEIGVNILKDLHKLSHLLPGVQHHHERFDGRGYPSGLAGEAIPLEARILAVADTFDALTSTRPYRDRLSPERIEGILREGAGVQWDAKVVEALLACRQDLERIRQKGLGESLQVVIDDTVGRPS